MTCGNGSGSKLIILEIAQGIEKRAEGSYIWHSESKSLGGELLVYRMRKVSGMIQKEVLLEGSNLNADKQICIQSLAAPKILFFRSGKLLGLGMCAPQSI